MNTREFTEEEKTKFEIEERIERLLPIELKNHYRTHIRSILELPERIRHKYTKKREEFWDNAAQELLSKYIAIVNKSIKKEPMGDRNNEQSELVSRLTEAITSALKKKEVVLQIYMYSIHKCMLVKDHIL